MTAAAKKTLSKSQRRKRRKAPATATLTTKQKWNIRKKAKRRQARRHKPA